MSARDDEPPARAAVESLAPRALSERLARGEALVLLDVREPEEHALGVIAGSVLLPMSELAARLDELDPARPTVCICHHGVRSAHVAAALARAGFARVLNLSGGVDRWSREVDATFPRY